MAGTVVADTIKGGTTAPPVFQRSDGTEIGQLCTAWAHVTVSGGAPTLRDSFNINSITDGGVGVFTVGIDVDTINTYYGVSLTSGGASGGLWQGAVDSYAVGSFRALIANNVGTLTDPDAFTIAIFGGR